MEELDMDPMILTNSDVEAFLNCRRAWGWGDVEGYNLPDKEVSAAALGTRVHGGILDGYYRDGSDPVAYHDKLCRDALTRMGDAGAPDWDFDQFYKDMVVGRNCVEAYMEWMAREGPDHGYTVEGVEQEVEAPILDGLAEITLARAWDESELTDRVGRPQALVPNGRVIGEVLA